MLAKVVLEDVLLLEVATKSISKENRTQKLALEFSKNSVPELLRLVNETTVYANNLLQLVIHENLEDVDYESGLGILQAMLGEIPRDGVVNLGKQSAIIKVLISATRYSWKRENGAFEKHFATYKPLMRAIVGVAQKLENARNEMNSLSSESFEDFVEQIVTASDLTRDICRVQHNCSAKTEQFVVLCSTHIFQTLRLLLTYYPKTISADVYVSKVSELISEETALLRSLVNGPLALPKKVILMTKGSLRGNQSCKPHTPYSFSDPPSGFEVMEHMSQLHRG
ncbi:hypothetical protein D915_000695 [Fasciola hepatica]|uniref:Uncharacterized protein n=1 Tax=Fasciola hepatica TaxID=6192 RepID=A0A4E0RZY4_FASHE|nr:hypothetical protein D915_000695 [Fasciola hepatica]